LATVCFKQKPYRDGSEAVAGQPLMLNVLL